MPDFLLPHLPMLRRGMIFIIGGLISYLLNLLPYSLLTHRGWTHDHAYALSLTWVTLLMFFWNYRVNFPTPRHWHHCALRYAVSVAATWGLNFYAVHAMRDWLAIPLAIFIVGFLIAVLKFGLYHWWVFPHRKDVPLA